MPVLQLQLTEREFEQLDEYARTVNQRAEQYAEGHFREWLSGHKERFRIALKSVLEENEELYKRLA